MNKKRQEQTQQEKYVSFKKAFGTFNHYLTTENYIGAFVIAFSILEDRVNALYFSRKKANGEPRPKGFGTYYKKLKYLLNQGDINNEIYNEFIECANDRNNKIHEAMRNLEEFKEEDCKRIIKCARKADKLRNEQRKKIGK